MNAVIILVILFILLLYDPFRVARQCCQFFYKYVTLSGLLLQMGSHFHFKGIKLNSRRIRFFMIRGSGCDSVCTHAEFEIIAAMLFYIKT